MHKNKSKVTVVTVTYNAEKYLEQTIKSVIEQDYSNIEYIIIDGASTDGTINIIKKYEKYITRWISEPDNGIYDAMNKGIDLATGEWINFMNAGDTLVDNILSFINPYLNNNIDLFYGGMNYVKEDGSYFYMPPYDLSNIYKRMPLCHQSLFIKTSIMKKYKYSTDFKINGDLDFILKCYTNNYPYKFTNEPICNFLYGGLHTKDIPRRYLDEIYVTSRYLKECKHIYEHESYLALKINDPSEKLNNNLTYHLFNKLLEEIEKINKSYSFVILYGNSSLAKIIEKFLNIEYLIADVNDNESKYIIKPSELCDYPYEIIINTLINKNEIVKESLLELGCPLNKIIYLDIS